MSRAHDMNCEQVRKQAYCYRRNELIGAETVTIEAHIEDCPGCRDYYARLGILLDAASSWDTAEEAGEAEDLFAGIAARIEEEPQLADEPAAEEETLDEEFDYDTGSRGWVSAVAGLAAGVVLTLGALYIWQQADEPAANNRPGVASVEADEEQNPEDGAETNNAAFAKLAREKSASKQVDVFASAGAKWSLSGDEELVLELEEGSVLVEFLPEGDHSLKVDAPDFSVRVVGTVFYVSADEKGPRAGVLAGEVEVSSSGGASATLTARREMGADFEPREMPAERAAELSRYVDPDEHLQKLDALARARTKKAETTEATKSTPRRTERAPKSEDAAVSKAVRPKPEHSEPERHLPPDLERLRARAERATRQGQYHDAVRYYRGLLERLPPVHPIAASVHLDVAHIYLHRLNSPGRAAPYLRTFVERWPTDVAAPSARDELCKIAEQTDEPEAGCEVQR